MERLIREDEGAVAVLVALLLVVFVGAAAISIDLGSAWETKRNIVTDTDAAALAGARLLASEGLDSCSSAGVQSAVRDEADAVLALNDADTVLNGPVEIECGSSFAVVRVDGSRDAQQSFTRAVGRDDLSARSRSGALVGPVAIAEGLLPLAFCDQLPAIDGYLAGGETDPSLRGTDPRYPEASFTGLDYDAMGAGLVHRIAWDKQSESDCGEASGNWGWQSFHSKSIGTGNCNGSDLDQLSAMICKGYGGGVSLGTPDAGFADKHCGIVDEGEIGNQDEKEDQFCWSRTGDPDSAHSQLRTSWLCQQSTQVCRDQGKVFTVIAFDAAVDKSGTSVKFHPIAFIGMILRDNDKIGSPATWTMDVEFTSAQVEGTVGQTEFDTGVVGYDLCMADDRENCAP